jgi:hypothetical protein
LVHDLQEDLAEVVEAVLGSVVLIAEVNVGSVDESQPCLHQSNQLTGSGSRYGAGLSDLVRE